MQFSLMFFADSHQFTTSDSYRLVIDATRFADLHSFAAVWTPERHFHDFGGVFPNPSLMSAALSMVTSRIQIRAGSLISPLHNTIRIAEDWSVVDNLSGGRIGISFGSGWNIDDFVLFPDRYSDRKAIMYEQIAAVNQLWSGGTVYLTNSEGKRVGVALSPKPVQPALPVWITSSGSVDTFAHAGQIGANILTHLIGQDMPSLQAKIDAYRSARSGAGFSRESGIVTLMLHTFLGDDLETVRRIVHAPFCSYLRSAVSLENKAALGGGTISGGHKLPAVCVSDEGIDELIELSFERYFREASLMGTIASCSRLLGRMEEIGVTEIACLIDFGVPAELILTSLIHLDDLRKHFTTDRDTQVQSMVHEFTETLE